MNKRLLFFILTLVNLLVGGKVDAQTYGNEWIKYNQKYFQFKITQTGFYKMQYSDLLNAGIPLNIVKPNNMQIFGKEKQVPLFMVDGGDNSFDNGDYFIFYAERNDGWLDSTLYTNPAEIGNPNYSLYNDTLTYFFTWNSLNTNLRYANEDDGNFAAHPPAPYIFWEQSFGYQNEYYEGKTIGNLSTSFYNDGEGYMVGKYIGPATVPFNFNTSYRYNGPGAPDAYFQGKSFSTNNPSIPNSGTHNHHLRWRVGSQDSLIFDTLWTDIRPIHFQGLIPAGSINQGTTQFKWNNVGDQPSGNDSQGFSYTRLKFAKEPNLSGFTEGKFKVVNSTSTAKIRLDLVGMTTAAPMVFVHGSTPRKLYLVPNGSNSYQTLIPNAPGGIEQTVLYASENSTLTVPALSSVNGTGFFTNFAATNADSAILMVYHSILADATNNYETYRKSAAGGNHTVVKANIDELYLQYGGGVPKHINAVRRFAHHMYTKSNQQPAALVLMGKGIREAPIYSYPFQTVGTRSNATYYSQSLIPSFGQPSSDIAITASLIPNNWAPLIPTGRLSVNTNTELQNYLEKIKEFDAAQNQNDVYNYDNKDWQKQVLHFGGGSNSSEQNLFRAYLEQMESTIETANFAGNVTKLYKVNSDPFDPALVNEITQRLSTGVSLINFFGHANPATNGFEINIENPSNWNNKGKYPIVIANTCLNGNIFHRETSAEASTSENFVRIPDAGAIAFISAVYLGFSNTLASYTQGLYEQMSQFSYGQTLGKQIQNNIGILQSNQNDYLLESNSLQMSLNGDPMIKLNWHEKPEIEIREDRVTFTPTKVDLTTDSILLSIDLRNLGKSVVDTFTVEIIRDFPQSNSDSLYVLRIPNLDYSRQIKFNLPLQPNIGIGLNKLTINIDLPSFIDENYDEVGNNKLTKNLLINIDGILPISPRKYAVVPKDSVVLKASTIDPLASTKTYFFEVDTTDLFDSPFKRYANITSVGGVKEAFPSMWKLTSNNQSAPLVCVDSTVYFWRVALDDGNFDWKESSFQYINGKQGWGQDHFFQFKENDFGQVKYLRTIRERQFVEGDTIQVEINANGPNYSTGSNNWLISGNQQDYDMCTFTPSIHVGVIDPASFTSWGTHYGSQNPDHSFGNANDQGACRSRVEKYFIFRQNSLQQLQAFQNMVLNEVPDGHYIVIYTPYNGARYDLWNAIDSANMYNTFALLGSDSIIAGRPNTPFAFFVRKGSPSTVVESVGQIMNQAIKLKAGMITNEKAGQETSTLVGPASKWNSFYWKLDPKESNSVDTTYFQIDAYNSAQQYQFTLDVPVSSNDSILFLENVIQAQSSPYLRLRALYSDTVTTTPGQLDRWHVLYDPLPEAAIDGTNGYFWTANGPDSLNEGQTISFAIDVRNVFDIDMDSLLVSYYVEDKNHIRRYISYARQDSLRVNETLRDTISISTIGLGGENIFWMEVNPYSNVSSAYDQPEQFHFNNLLQIPFTVNTDSKNPILDVTFDGRHILNGDIVNPNSEILMSLKDDNPYLIMNDISDTTLFGIYLTGPDGIQKRIPFELNGQTVMQWIPADPQSKRFKIIYPAAFEQDGKYTLFVQGNDRSGNLSGDMDYRITFEVIRESKISYLMNYPNPFSTSTRFVFTLTGSEIPDDMIIQIMTINGRVVREITESQFGPIYIGRNISEYAWDGTDEFGDRLANGVYLYRVKMKIKGEDIKHLESGADSFFTKEFGKMYLMR